MSKLDDGIPFGQTFTYLWNITANFAPGKDDDNCVPWGYHSHVDSMKDIESGLVGLLVICNQGDKLDTKGPLFAFYSFSFDNPDCEQRTCQKYQKKQTNKEMNKIVLIKLLKK